MKHKASTMDEFMEELLFENQWRSVYIDNVRTDYEISIFGELRNACTGLLMKTFTTSCGYESVALATPLGRKVVLIHRLVAQAFIPNPENKPAVNHIDGNKQNNHVSNLEWVTYKENMEHAVEHGLLDVKGDHHPENVYTEKQIRHACQLATDISANWTEIAKITGVPRHMIEKIVKRTTWVHISSEYNLPTYEEKIRYNYEHRGYTDEQLHEACKLLEQRNLTIPEIARLIGIKEKLVAELSYGGNHKDISSQYNIPRGDRNKSARSSFASITEEEAHAICKLLENPELSYVQISKVLGVSCATVTAIGRGDTWKHISSKYNFPQKRIIHRQKIHKCDNDISSTTIPQEHTAQ